MTSITSGGWLPLALLLTLVAASIVGVAGPRDVSAADYTCFVAGSCTSPAQCSGDYYDRNGCTVQCFTIVGGGEINPAGSATCTSSTGGGSGGGGDDDYYDEDWWCGSPKGCY